jgi:hypothetical protein
VAELLLNYDTQPANARLEEFDGGVRLTFPVLSRRLRLVNMIAWLFAAIVQTCAVGQNIWMWRSIRQAFAAMTPAAKQYMPTLHAPVSGIIMSTVIAILYWIGGIVMIRKTRQQSIQPEVWEATANELIIWRFNRFSLRRTIHHPVGVQSVKAKPVRDIFDRKHIVLLAIELNNGRKRIARRMTGGDSFVATRAATAFRKVLNLSEEDN